MTFICRKLSDDPHSWNLHKFFTEMFNYCFPTDYQQQMRMNLEDLCQGSQQTVLKYMYELQELFNMVGAMPLEFKVLKLWYTLRPRIQKTMCKDGLHPDTSTWDEIVAKSKVIEIADHVIVKGCSALSDISSHNSLSLLYIPPHRR